MAVALPTFQSAGVIGLAKIPGPQGLEGIIFASDFKIGDAEDVGIFLHDVLDFQISVHLIFSLINCLAVRSGGLISNGVSLFHLDQFLSFLGSFIVSQVMLFVKGWGENFPHFF